MLTSTRTSSTQAAGHLGTRLLAFVAVLAIATGIIAAPRATAWDFIYGNAGPDDYSRYMAVALAPDGGSYITGFFSGSFQSLSSPNEYRYFLQRVSAAGSIVWTREVPTATLPGTEVPPQPQLIVDGLGTPILQADHEIFSYTSAGDLVSSIPSPDTSISAHMSAAGAGGFVMIGGSATALKRYDSSLSLLWSFNLGSYIDVGFRGSVAVGDGTFWVVGAKGRVLVTQADATALVHIAADGTKIAAIKHYGFEPQLMSDDYDPIVGASDSFIMVATTEGTIKSFAASDGHYLGDVPSVHPSHPFASSRGPLDCGGVDLLNQSVPPVGANPPVNATAIRKVVMNGTRLIALVYCGGVGVSVPVLVSYSIAGLGPNALSFLSARELTGATSFQAMDANDLGDEIVVGSSNSTAVFVGGTRSTVRTTANQRALAAKNPLGSLFYGLRASNTVLELKVGGRGSVPANAAGVSLNLTAVGEHHAGLLAVYPCGSSRTNAATLTYATGVTVANSVVSKLGKSGKVCIFTSQATHLTVDVAGHFPAGSSFVGRNPARFLETRTGVSSTLDGKYFRLGERAAKSVTAMTVTGRGGVPSGAKAAVVTVHVVAPRTAGALIVYPCGTVRPPAANMTFAAGQTLSTTAIVKLGTAGQVCFYTTARTHLAADVSGHFAASTSFVPFTSRRLLDTRPVVGGTVDGRFRRAGERTAKSVTQVLVRSRGGIPSNATSVSLNVTVYSPKTAGSVTVYACGATRPATPNVFFTAGKTTANALVARVGSGGNVCVYTSAAAQLALDANGHFLGASAYQPRSTPGRYVDTRAR